MHNLPTTCRTCGRNALPETLARNSGECMVCVRKARDDELAEAVRQERAVGSISLFSTPFFLRANKSTSYRDAVLVLSRSLAEGLEELGLTRTCLPDRFSVNNEHFYITDSDLNESGNAFAKIAFRSWLAKTDRWKPESRTVVKLKASLVAEYEKFQAARVAA